VDEAGRDAGLVRDVLDGGRLVSVAGERGEGALDYADPGFG